MSVEDFEYVAFTCPYCGTTQTRSREDRWGMTKHSVPCLGDILGGYQTCTANIEVEQVGKKVFVRVNGQSIPAQLTNTRIPRRYGY